MTGRLRLTFHLCRIQRARCFCMHEFIWSVPRSAPKSILFLGKNWIHPIGFGKGRGLVRSDLRIRTKLLLLIRLLGSPFFVPPPFPFLIKGSTTLPPINPSTDHQPSPCLTLASSPLLSPLHLISSSSRILTHIFPSPTSSLTSSPLINSGLNSLLHSIVPLIRVFPSGSRHLEARM